MTELPRQVKDIAGKKFGRLTALRFTQTKPTSAGATAYWWCVCECGVEREMSGSSLRSGNTKSCGCLEKELTIARNTRHGEAARGAKTPEYICWRNMLARCYSKNATRFELYGGRGIEVCDRWRFGEDGLSGFECFVIDMGRRPTPLHSIDRRNNDRGYYKNNCRWTVQVVQTRNSRHNTLIETPLGRLPMSEAAEVYGVPYGQLRSRIRSGWEHAAALTSPKAAAHIMLVDGKPVTLEEAAVTVGTTVDGIRARLKRGMTPDEAVTIGRMKSGPKAKRPQSTKPIASMPPSAHPPSLPSET